MSEPINKPDGDPERLEHGSDHSVFEQCYWQMLIQRESHCSVEDPCRAYERVEIEHMFRTWNERFGTNVQPRWIIWTK